MKNRIIPVLLLCIAFPCIVARVFQMDGHQDTKRENREEWYLRESPSCRDDKPAGQVVSYDELSNKQINYLIP